MGHFTAFPSAPPMPIDFGEETTDRQSDSNPTAHSLSQQHSWSRQIKPGAPDTSQEIPVHEHPAFQGFPAVPQLHSQQLGDSSSTHSGVPSTQTSTPAQQFDSSGGRSVPNSSNDQSMPSRRNYVVRPQSPPRCCCLHSISKVTGRDNYPPQLQDRLAASEICRPQAAESQTLPAVNDPVGRWVAHPYHQAWRFRGLYSFLLVAMLLGTGIAYLIIRHRCSSHPHKHPFFCCWE